jgi:hypothetical protein
VIRQRNSASYRYQQEQERTPDAPGDRGVQRQLHGSVLRELGAITDPIEVRRIVYCFVLDELPDVACRSIGQRVSPGCPLGLFSLCQGELSLQFDAPIVGNGGLPSHMNHDRDGGPHHQQHNIRQGRDGHEESRDADGQAGAAPITSKKRSRTCLSPSNHGCNRSNRLNKLQPGAPASRRD